MELLNFQVKADAGLMVVNAKDDIIKAVIDHYGDKIPEHIKDLIKIHDILNKEHANIII